MSPTTIGAALGFIIGSIILAFAASDYQDRLVNLEQTAIEYGYMGYDSKTGTLEWVVPNP